ncbi:acetate--CoA ligase family protein [Alloalcanivorax mobilis]|uniref:acetate--CoA ligase family protein n=1 Tax=Alloalcanivorax mobilis TaxID=2019569 RepID=UPI000C757FBB|nr:acetate--CoA ligase family protein [Alloalcanivorax mobilis]
MSTPRDLRALFAPRSVAVIGAAGNPAAIGGQPIKHLLDHGYPGNIYPINPKYEEIAGLRCYPDIKALPETPDLVIIAVAARMVADMVRAIGEAGVGCAIVFSSGFAETGEDGHTAQRELRELAERVGVTLIGPNCQGLINVSADIPLGFGAPYALTYRKGAVGLTSQSGAFGNSLLMALNDEGVGFHHYISTGNEAATTSLDCYEYFLEQPEIRVVAGYVEGFSDARRLRVVAERALDVAKPLVLWKVGNTEEGAKAASSHTANLAGASTYYHAAFDQYGVIGVDDIGDMADCVRALLTERQPQNGNGVAVLSVSGGAGIVMADRCIEQGLTLSLFSQATNVRLKELLPEFASIANPVDMTAGAINDPQAFAEALRAIVDDSSVDMLGICLAALSGPHALTVAREVAKVHAQCELPILIAWNATLQGNEEAYQVYEDAGIPVYGSPVRCARGLGALGAHGAALARHRRQQGERAGVQTVLDARPVDVTATRALNEYDAKQLMQRYQLPVTREAAALDADQAATAAADFGFPVVMKILSSAIAHKSDIGGVRVGIADQNEARQVFAELRALTEQHAPDSPFEGVLVQEMVSGGTEVIVGAVNDPSFGPVIMFGAGGVYAEVFGDVAFRLAPLNREDADALIDATKISRIIAGARGTPPGDREALVGAILSLSELVVAEADRFTEIDINPLVVLPQGQGARVLDAFMRVRE